MTRKDHLRIANALRQAQDLNWTMTPTSKGEYRLNQDTADGHRKGVQDAFLFIALTLDRDPRFDLEHFSAVARIGFFRA
jgi:hypothetical protein